MTEEFTREDLELLKGIYHVLGFLQVAGIGEFSAFREAQNKAVQHLEGHVKALENLEPDRQPKVEPL